MHVIGTLSSTAHEEIFRMINQSGAKHTKNKHGIHVNLSLVDNAIIGKISAFVDYCVSKDRELEEYTDKLQKYRAHKRFNYGHDGPVKSSAVALERENLDDDDGDLHVDDDNNIEGARGTKVAVDGDLRLADAENGENRDSSTPQDPGDTPAEMPEPRSGEGGSVAAASRDADDLARLQASLQADLDAPSRRFAANSKFNSARKKFARKKPLVHNERHAIAMAQEGLLEKEEYVLTS